MKKLFAIALVAAVVSPVFAQEAETAEEKKSAPRAQERKDSFVWPAFFAVCEFPANPDVCGLRLAFPFSTRQVNVTGIDLGLWARCHYFEGIAVNLLRNDVKDRMAGFQVGCYNSIGGGEMLGLQVGLWNEANYIRGLQLGIVNVTGEAQGFQFGLINRSDTMYGYQVGLINIIRDAELQFCPIINIGF